MEEEQLPEIGKPETFPYDQWDDTVQYWRLGDPPIQRPEKASGPSSRQNCSAATTSFSGKGCPTGTNSGTGTIS